MNGDAAAGGPAGGLRRPLPRTQLELYIRLDSSTARERILSAIVPQLATVERAAVVEIKPGLLRLEAKGDEAAITKLKREARAAGWKCNPSVTFTADRTTQFLPVAEVAEEEENCNIAGLPSGRLLDEEEVRAPRVFTYGPPQTISERHPPNVTKPITAGAAVGKATMKTPAYTAALGGWAAPPNSARALAAAERVSHIVFPVSANTELRTTISRLIAEAKEILDTGRAPPEETDAPPVSPLTGVPPSNVSTVLRGAAERIKAVKQHISEGLRVHGVTNEGGKRDKLVLSIMTYMKDKQMWGGARRKTRHRRQRKQKSRRRK